MSGRYTYLRDPAAIYRESFATIGREADLAAVPEPLRPLAVRVVHACGMVDAVADLAFSPDAMTAGRAALAGGRPILCDVEMVAHGVIRRRVQSPVICTLSRPEVPIIARRLDTTRSAAAVDLWREHLFGAVVAIGNAPTALFRLLELLAEGAPRPAVILGFPVGFVGAAESKEALIADAPLFGVPFVTMRGRRGGSAMAAAAVNALAAPLDAEQEDRP
ncbi:precorrin-8X methylmutase [Caenispirillum bisanense]|uniref:Precorrin-8X methylmutase n=1 Tax=Caenispirillum bisanense TaxID=414052 RepID=A0A286GU54_9PROT|nr:precorrin-8X methylmutase [Caenispirillum bisanense]SOD98992.1 precorrin-8X methylmutase [Caenispirillum bisanense]